MSHLSSLRFAYAASLAILIFVAVACQTSPETPSPATPAVSPAPSASPTQPARVTPSRTRSGPTATSTPLPGLFVPEQTYRGLLTLVEADLPIGDCEQASPFDLPADGLIQVAFVPTQVCFNEEIGLLEIGDRLVVVQGGGYPAAFTLTDVTDPTQPEFIGAWEWKQLTYTADVKTFRQGERWYLVLSLEASGDELAGAAPCGIAIVEVSDPRAPKLIGNTHGQALGSTEHWCNVHTTEVDTDANGDGSYILVSSNDTADLRVVDIRDLSRVREVGRYRTSKFETYRNGRPSTFVHDSTIVGDRVYVAYWDGGLIILDKAQLESGAEVTPLNQPGSIDPVGFSVHHSYPTTDGNFVFIEDEVDEKRRVLSQVRLWDIRDLSAPKEVFALELDDPIASPHNLLVDGDLLYVGWYQEGVRVFRYDVSDPERPIVEPAFAQSVRAKRVQGVFGSPYDGVWGVRVHACEVEGKATTCIYASDLTLGLIILALP